MSGRPTALDLMSKAERASASARVLVDLGDVDGACNRAYYAMFDAAKAALILSASIGRETIGKSHSGILNAFSEHLVKSGRLPKDMGRMLKHAETFRYVADYEGGSVERADAYKMVEQAEVFIASIKSGFKNDLPP